MSVTTSLCPECGIIRKTGKLSCCARGGSWFRTCSAAGDTSLGHTWKEGIAVCKARQSRVAVHHASQQNSNASSDDASMGINDKFAIATAQIFEATPANMSISMAGATSVMLSTDTSLRASNRQLTSKTVSAATTTTAHNAEKILKPKLTLSPVNETITSSANRRATNAIHSVLTGLVKMTSAHTVASVSMTAQIFEKLLCVVTHTSTIFIITSWS